MKEWHSGVTGVRTVCRVTPVFNRWASSSYIAGAFERSRSESANCDIWCRVAYVCVRISQNYRWYMIVLRIFRKCFILQPCFDAPVWKFLRVVKTFQEASKIVQLQLGAPTSSNFVQKLPKREPKGAPESPKWILADLAKHMVFIVWEPHWAS